MSKEKYSSEFKVRTVLEGLKSPDGIAVYCRRVGISDVQFYQWQKQMIENADALFSKVPKATERKLAHLESEIKRKDQIIAIVTEEALELKKNSQIVAGRHLSYEIKLDLWDMIGRYSQYGWSKEQICHKWGISIKTFYALRHYAPRSQTASRNQLNAITEKEIQAVIAYALIHTELNHREMSYRMIDENVAFLGPSSIYRILSKNSLLVRREKRDKPEQWNPHQKLTAPDLVWQTDLMSISYGHREYYLLSYLDVYSRYIVFHKLCLSMTGDTIREVTLQALDQTGKRPLVVQSDNGSCYISNEYRSFLSKSGVEHRKIHPHCPNENAEIERYHRTVREIFDPQDASDLAGLYELVNERIQFYNHVRYHSAIGFVPPYAKYAGAAEKISFERAEKLAKAKRNRIMGNFKRLYSIVDTEAA